MAKNNVNITALVQAHLKEAKRVQQNNARKHETFQARTEELRKQIHDNRKHFNDI